MTATTAPERIATAPTGRGRLYRGQTAVDFIGRRKIGLFISVVLLVLTVLSLFTRGLNLGIDFEGGVSWDVPANEFTIDDAQRVLDDNGLGGESARIQTRQAAGASGTGNFIKVQVGDQTREVGDQLRAAFADAANVGVDDVNTNLVSSSWGSDITNKALRALVIFLVLVAIFISIRFEWKMAMAAIAAMAHDVVISVGIYSIFGFLVTPATVIAFLTILGYSLYDTIVVFDRVRENEARFAAHSITYDDIINVSMNQVIMRSMNTSFSSIVPVVSLLLIGAGVLGATTLSEFALALLVGMVTGAYSSIFVATPLLSLFKGFDDQWKTGALERAKGETLRDMVMGGMPVGKRARMGARSKSEVAAPESGAGETPSRQPGTSVDASVALSHPPRPRRKKRR